jgi:hypothetical protein
VTLFRDGGFAFEWNLVRVGSLANNLGEVYVDLRGLGGEESLNLEMGRFQIPFGENYLRFSKGYSSDPFVALSAPPPWFWDEGVKLWGRFLDGKASYAFAWTDGEGPLNADANGSQQLSLKLAIDPVEWLHVSASAMRTGELGNDSTPAFAAVWLGEMIPRAFGAGATAPNFDHGVIVPNGPNQIRNLWIVGGDVIAKFPDLRLWLSYGGAKLDHTGGPSLYDRNLIYWLAEGVFQLRAVSPLLSPVYLAARASGFGTYNQNEGYLLDFRYPGVGYNMRALNVYALAVGMPIGDHLNVKAQYAFQQIALVHGVTSAIEQGAKDANFFGVELGVHF